MSAPRAGGAGMFLREAWSLCAAAVDRPGDPFRTPVLAGFHAEHGVQARTVVLRAVDDVGKVLEIHGDARTDKVAAIGGDARVALLFWDSGRRLQLRVEGRAAVLDAGSHRAAQVFAGLSDRARAAYRHRPDPGSRIPAADRYDAEGDARIHFRLIRIEALRLEALSLADGTQARAEWRGAGDRGEATWIVP